MTMVPPKRVLIAIEGAQYLSAVSEGLIQNLAATDNFISLYQYSEKQFFANGRYNISGTPQTAVDGLTFFQFDSEVIDVWMFVEFAGSSGTTELDILSTTSSGGSFTSIFSTTPKIQSSAGNYAYIHVGSTVPNTTAPVLATSTFTAGTALRLDILQAQGGNPITTGLLVHYRPTSL